MTLIFRQVCLILSAEGEMKRQTDKWSKVLLGAYRYLPSAAEAAKAEAQKLALSGFSFDGDIVELMGKVIDCNKRVENYVNAYVLVRESLRRIGAEKTNLLKDVYCDLVPVADLAESMGISHRRATRRIAAALSAFECACSVQGYAEEWFDKRLKGDILFCKVAERLETNPAYLRSALRGRHCAVRSIG